ncbi:iron(III) transport system permease protein [Primorskyibacter flagellatus]|uniref:Iron(III) transport system permease protein n=1 Tax=Primorskyibacter flagellatus TaxID=1387277 RepID=A0A1W2EIK5_9RHOB|nr:iron(III) transport system permease protein [Primorskyibacter flagellatus]
MKPSAKNSQILLGSNRVTVYNNMPKRLFWTLRPELGLGGERALLLALVLFVGVLSIAPLARLAYAALVTNDGFDLDRIVDVLGGRRVLEATVNTIWIAVSATLISTVLGTIAALLCNLTDMRKRSLWVFGFMLPLMIPPQVIALAWVQAFSPASPLLGILGWSLPPGMRHPLYSMGGIILLLGLYNGPLVFLSVRASLQRLPASMIEAAHANGAGHRAATLDIILPLIRSGIFAGAALAFVSAIGNFGIQAMLGIPGRVPTLITLIYRRLNSYGTSALNDMALLALLLAVLTVGGMTLTAWLGRQGDQRVETAQRPPRIALGRWGLPIVGIAWLYHLIFLMLPLSALFGTALVRGYGQPVNFETITFQNFSNALFYHEGIRDAFLTSLWVTLTTVAVLIPVAVALGYVLTWRQGCIAQFLRMASEMAYALPGIIIGVAMILFFLRPLPFIGTGLYGTVWVILAAYMSNFLALALRPILGGYAQLDRGLDEAAQLAGAGIFARLRDIVLPSLAPAVMASAILVFMTAINEIQTSVLLVSSRAQTIGPMIIFLEEAGSSTLAAAVGCLMVVMVLVLMSGSLLLGNRLPEGVLPWRD